MRQGQRRAVGIRRSVLSLSLSLYSFLFFFLSEAQAHTNTEVVYLRSSMPAYTTEPTPSKPSFVSKENI